MPSQMWCQANPEFIKAVVTGTTITNQVAAEAMNEAIQIAVAEADKEAPWAEDGTEHDGWVTTGMSRRSFVGFVPGYFPAVTDSWSFKDDHGHVHFSDPGLTEAPLKAESRNVIQAVLMRYANNTGFLQAMELDELGGFGHEPPVQEWTPLGETTEQRVMSQIRDAFWQRVAVLFVERFRIHMRSRGGFIW